MIVTSIPFGELGKGPASRWRVPPKKLDWSGELGFTPCSDPMPTEPPVGVCNPDVISRKYFAPCEGVRLTVPDSREDKHLRSLIVYGASLEGAYNAIYGRSSTLTHLIPKEVGLHACIKDVLKTERMDMVTGGMVPQYPGNWTCIEFWRCYADFINAKRKFEGTEKTGRIQLGENAFVPSLPEQECIRKDWLDTADLGGAYERCGASDIIPWWEGGLSGLISALRTKINVNIYDVLKASYTFATMEIIQATPTIATPTKEMIRRRREMLKALEEERKKTPAWVYALIAFGVGSIIIRR